MKAQLRFLFAALSLIALASVLAGCGSGSSSSIYMNLYQRASWQQIVGGRLAFASRGGNGLLYVYNVTDTGGGLTLLTPSFNQSPPLNVLEGGFNPVYSPNGNTIAFVSRRGGANNASQTIYSMSAANGDQSTVTTPLSPLPNDSNVANGADDQPNWSPDGATIIYSSTRNNGVGSLRSVPAGGGAPVTIMQDGNDNQWPCFNPQNANEIVLQSDKGLSGVIDPLTGNPATGIFIFDRTQPLSGTNPRRIAQAASSTVTDGAPSWSPDGSMIAFHSDRAGDFDIWVYIVASDTSVQVTSDARSDGYPVWNLDSTRLGFTRNRELWTVGADGSNPVQLTKVFQQ